MARKTNHHPNKKDKVEIVVPYCPRPHQRDLHNSLKRFNVLVCHRRFGKTVFCINEIIRKAMENPNPRPRYAYIAPTLRQAKRVAWDYIKHFTSVIPYVEYNEAELRVDLPNGSRIYILGAENPDSLRGIYLDGAILDEVAQMPPSVWGEVIRPTLSDRKGWAIFIGTPKGENYFYKLYQQGLKLKGWNAQMYKVSETGIIDDDELENLRMTMSDSEYEQEYECSFVASIKGSYYAELLDEAEKADRIDHINWDPTHPVMTAWDIGLSDKTCIWFFQLINNNIYLIDYHEDSDKVLSHYANIVKSKPYVYDYHIMPHDVSQRSFDTGRTRLQQLRSLGLKCVVAPKTPVLDGINASRAILPRCYFDRAKCYDGIRALRHYRSQYDEGKDVFSEKPIHDWSSHAADAFRYLAMGMRKQITMPGLQNINEMEFNPFKQTKVSVDAEWDPYNMR